MSANKTPIIEWRDEYSVGVADIDAQHKHLFFLLNEINQLDNVRNNRDNHLMNLLEQLNEYAAYHFLNEEKLLHEHLAEVEGSTQHISAHRSYWMIMADFKKRHQEGDPKVAEELLVYLNRWWLNHILETDQSMGAELNRRGIH